MAKGFFKDNDVEFSEVDVAADQNKAKEMVDKSGQMGVPVIIVGDEVVIGFDRPKLSDALGIS
jgi:glutaredoxin 3